MVYVKSEPQVDSMVCGAGDVTLGDCSTGDRRSGDLDLSEAGCLNDGMFKLCRRFEDVDSLNLTFVLESCNYEIEIIFFHFKDIAEITQKSFFKIFKGCLPQNLIGPFLNTLTQIGFHIHFLSYLGAFINYRSRDLTQLTFTC